MIQSINVVILFCITTIKLFEILTQQRAGKHIFNVVSFDSGGRAECDPKRHFSL